MPDSLTVLEKLLFVIELSVLLMPPRDMGAFEVPAERTPYKQWRKKWTCQWVSERETNKGEETDFPEAPGRNAVRFCRDHLIMS